MHNIQLHCPNKHQFFISKPRQISSTNPFISPIVVVVESSVQKKHKRSLVPPLGRSARHASGKGGAQNLEVLGESLFFPLVRHCGKSQDMLLSTLTCLGCARAPLSVSRTASRTACFFNPFVDDNIFLPTGQRLRSGRQSQLKWRGLADVVGYLPQGVDTCPNALQTFANIDRNPRSNRGF